MTREEQIRKAADDYCGSDTREQSPCFYAHIRNAFLEGAEWADQHPNWISVEERLPEEREVVWVRKHFNKEVLGEFDIYDSAAFCNGEFQCDNSCTITHWMEIVPPEEEE